jgi:replication initiation and membrane attachment protein
MKIITSQDFIQLRLEAVISSADLDFLVEAYGPIIGIEAVGLFLAIKQQDSLLEGNPINLPTFLSLLQTTPQTFHAARVQLEALGLLRTFEQTYQQTKLFTFTLFAPKSPQGFFDDPILKGLLGQRTSATYSKQLLNKYALPPLDPKAKEVTVSFGEVFHPDLNHPAFLSQPNSPQMKGKTFGEIRQPFDQLKFAEQLQHQFNLDLNKLNPEEVQQVISIATLTGLDELALADIVGTNLDLNHHLNLDKIMQAARQDKQFSSFIRQRQQQKVQLQSSSSQATLINQMELLSPVEFLVMKQNGAEVSPADFSLLMRLQNQYALTAPVINALIHQVLTTQNNVLSSRYVEKLAGTLKRENLSHAIDTMDYFYKLSQPRQSKAFTNKSTQTETTPTANPPLPSATPEAVDEAELAALEEKMKGLK